MEKTMRLDKYLADMTEYSRSEIKTLAKERKITVNGNTNIRVNQKVSSNDVICIGDKRITYEPFVYYLLNKPAGYLCTLDFSPNVIELIASPGKDLSPVGRLDKDTEGLILITNDGQLNHRLLSPKNHIEKTYYVETNIAIPDNANDVLSKPIVFSDFISEPALLTVLAEDKAYLTIHEGKFHQVKRMFNKIGCEVTYLKRVSFAFLTIDDLEVGDYRVLTESEVNKLKSM